jgi:hypothetical protein
MDIERDRKEKFQSEGCLVVPNFFKTRDLYNYSKELSKKSHIGDNQIPGSPVAYCDPVMEVILIKALPKVEALVGLALYKTYSYWRMYRRGDILRIHKDRPACEISVTMTIGYDGPRPWPVYLLNKNEDPVKIDLEAGDALIYKGIERYHGRGINNSGRQAQVFLHYVDKNGPYSEWKDDKRNIDRNLASSY